MVLGKRRKLIEIKVTDVEKRRYPSKHYVYIIQATWDDQSNTVIFRRYSKFFDFQIALLESFPKEGGLRDPSERIIPFLPGKILFGRSHVKEVALKRMRPIDEYCSALIQLPPHISNSELVLDFFESKPEDLNPNREDPTRKKKTDDQDINEISGPILLEQYRVIADFTRTQAKELTIATGQHVEVIEKHENGWWFVSDEEGERGWVPGVYLETRDGQSENLITKQAEPGKGEKYITTSQFTGGNEDEVTFGSGVLVEVLEKNLEGWWYISYKDKKGWAPASYLEKPADAVLRQNRHLSPVIKATLEHRRSFPGDGESSPDLSSRSGSTGASKSIKLRKNNLKLVKTNSNPSMLSDLKSTISNPIPNQPRPPPKRSSVALKPHKPPPLPPAPKISSDPVYDYVTTAPFAGNVPHGINFKQDQKVKVLEKSPGDWWLIALDGREGWAPASHVKRVYRQEKAVKAPERPRPPSVSNKPALVKSVSAPPKDNSPKSENLSSRPQQLRPSPLPPPQSSKNSASAKKPIQPIKPAPPKFSAKPVAESTVSTAGRDFINPVKSAPLAVNRNPPGAPKPPAKPAAKPLPASSKPKLNISKSMDGSRHDQKPTSPPANLSKPAVAVKKFSNSCPAEENKTNQHDFRSVLKSSSNHTFAKKNGVPSKSRPAVPGKPTLPVKPSSKAAGAKPTLTSNDKSSTQAKAVGYTPPKPPITSSKPVLRRFQNHNSNNNNEELERVSKPEIVVNRVEVECSASNLTFVESRGPPDGQDDVSVDESDFRGKSSKNYLESDAKASLAPESENSRQFVAVSDFTPEHPTELAFSAGDVASLVEKLEDDWWLVEIKGHSGWAPSFCFKQTSNKYANIDDSVATDSLKSDSSRRSSSGACDDSIYSEIGDFTERDDSELYCVVQSYSTSEQSTVRVGQGDLVQVLDKSDTGWSFVRIAESETEFVNREGWVPSDHLRPRDSLT